MDKLDQAIKDAHYALKLQPTANRYYRCGLLSAHQTHWIDALLYMTKTLEVDPQHIEAMTERGRLYNTLERFEQALIDLNTAIQHNPTYHIAWVHRADVYIHCARWDEAIKDATHVIRLMPTYALPYKLRAIAYEEKGLIKKAIKNFSQYLTLAPQSPETTQIKEKITQLSQNQAGKWFKKWFKR
jgi:regulator of sirC expression with transglutaminase-like and TPR domain